MKKKSVIITGAAGFIGRHVANEFFNQGWHVIGVGRGNWLNWADYGLSNWHNSDVNIESLLNCGVNPEVIVHCAGGASVGYSLQYPSEDFQSTVLTTSYVLEYIRKNTKSTKLVYLSSAAVYGKVNTIPISENSTLNPISPYGVHKKMAEDLCKLYSNQYNIQVSIVRLFSIYGAGLRKQLIWDACQKLKQNDFSFFGTGNEVRDWLHVRDVTRLLYLAEKNASTLCPVINAGSGIGTSVKDILNYLSTKFQNNTVPTFSSQPKTGDPDAYVADISKALEINWSPKIPLTTGIAEYVDWYKKCQ